jgi:hypothetical protein
MEQKKIYAKVLGIDLSSKQEAEYFKWFLACLLFGKPIQGEWRTPITLSSHNRRRRD